MACEPTWSISSGSRPLKNGCALRNVRLSTVCGGIAYSSYILSRMVTHCSLTLRSVRIYFTREPIAKLPSDNWDCGNSRLAMIARRVFCKPALDQGAVDAMHWQFLDAVRLCGVSSVSN